MMSTKWKHLVDSKWKKWNEQYEKKTHFARLRNFKHRAPDIFRFGDIFFRHETVPQQLWHGNASQLNFLIFTIFLHSLCITSKHRRLKTHFWVKKIDFVKIKQTVVGRKLLQKTKAKRKEMRAPYHMFSLFFIYKAATLCPHFFRWLSVHRSPRTRFPSISHINFILYSKISRYQTLLVDFAFAIILWLDLGLSIRQKKTNKTHIYQELATENSVHAVSIRVSNIFYKLCWAPHLSHLTVPT